MTYAFTFDVPSDEQMYRQVRAAIGDERPKGLVLHLVVRADTGLRHIDVWETKQDWERFHDVRVAPALHTALTAAGFTELPPEPAVEELNVVDVWMG